MTLKREASLRARPVFRVSRYQLKISNVVTVENTHRKLYLIISKQISIFSVMCSENTTLFQARDSARIELFLFNGNDILSSLSKQLSEPVFTVEA